ncbi:MAG: hypothetical protein ACAI25_05330 [Planctomycetota bacterium]
MSEQRRPLSTRAKVIIGAGAVSVVVLIVASVLAARSARAITETNDALARGAPCVRELAVRYAREQSRGDDSSRLSRGPYFVSVSGGTPSGIVLNEGGEPVASGPFLLDAWRHRVIFITPGFVHRNGWDLYSVGPNGIDEQGQGDDILVGEDVALVTSER